MPLQRLQKIDLENVSLKERRAHLMHGDLFPDNKYKQASCLFTETLGGAPLNECGARHRFNLCVTFALLITCYGRLICLQRVKGKKTRAPPEMLTRISALLVPAFDLDRLGLRDLFCYKCRFALVPAAINGITCLEDGWMFRDEQQLPTNTATYFVTKLQYQCSFQS